MHWRGWSDGGGEDIGTNQLCGVGYCPVVMTMERARGAQHKTIRVGKAITIDYDTRVAN